MDDLIIDCDRSKESVAEIAYEILKHDYVYTNRGWYKFNGTYWSLDKEELGLCEDLSSTVRDQFISTTNHLIFDDHPNIENLYKIARNLNKCHFKNSVVKQLKTAFHDSDFINKLDSNRNLLAFTNGVWDFKEHAFRRAVPEDYISITVGYDYNPVKDTRTYDEIVNYWSKLHPDKGQRDYVVKMFARHLQGDNDGFILYSSSILHLFFIYSQTCDYVILFSSLETGVWGAKLC